MLRLVATTGVFFNCLLLLEAGEHQANADSAVTAVTWENAFRPIYSEAASYPRATALSDGRLLVAFAHPSPVGKAIACLFSSDGGKSWGTPVTAAEKKGSRDGMPGVVRLNDQELLAVFEAQDVPPFRFVIQGVRSPDLGRTWSAARQLVYRPNHAVAAPWSAGAPSIIRLRDGRLMVSFQSDENNAFKAGVRRRDPTHSEYDYLRHTQFACVTSLDQGKSCTAPVHLLGGPDDPANWNALYAVTDGTVFALSNHRGRIWIKAGATDGKPVPRAWNGAVVIGTGMLQTCRAPGTMGRLDPNPGAPAMIRCIMFLAAVVAAVQAPAQDANALRVYFVGNSVTDTINYRALAELAKSRGHQQIWVRDEIPHSKDAGHEIVTCRASEVLRHRTGICYAKSHLLAALLRAGGVWEAPWRLADDYHVYGLDWGKDELKFYVDGVLVRSVENTHWHQPLFLIFDSETMPQWFGMPDDNDLPSAFSVEYVRAWKRK